MSGTIMLAVAREVQIPLLAALLIGGCAAKARRAVTARSISAATGPTAMFRLRLRQPAAIGLCASELALGLGLLLTATRAGAGLPALAVRGATALLFGTAVAALYELRAHRPGAGCGCFGELSRTPVGWRVMARAALLGVAALASVGAPPLTMPASAARAWLALAVAGAELAVLAALSPEVSQILIRLSHTDPCELRQVPVARTLSVLHASASWRRYREMVVDNAPADVWREGCWRFLAFAGAREGRRVEVVFAVSLAGRHGPVHAGLLEADAGFTAARRTPADDPLQMSNGL